MNLDRCWMVCGNGKLR